MPQQQHQQGQQHDRRGSANQHEHMEMEVIVDGPYGAPTQDHKHFRNLVLVGAGIGLTPMVSVLKSLLHERYPDTQETMVRFCKRCFLTSILLALSTNGAVNKHPLPERAGASQGQLCQLAGIKGTSMSIKSTI